MTTPTIASMHRSTQALCTHLCEKHTLKHGIAYYHAELRHDAEANQFREVVIGEPGDVRAAFQEAEACFREQGITCLRWALAADQVADGIAPFLADAGFVARPLSAWLLTQWVDRAPPAGVRVLPARAMRSALQRMFESADPDPARADAFEVCLRRMDDAQYDLFLAMVGDRPAGRCALYQVGDFARVTDLFVADGFDEEMVGASLLAHVLAMARRLSMRKILTLHREGENLRRALLEAWGFVEDGRFDEFDRLPPGAGQP
jgi:N-acetylglutamate synthase-like GNAT family acetyltransferase